MNKQKAIIFGMGSGYKKRENAIMERYEIIAFTDNSGQAKGYERYISPLQIAEMNYDVILICSIPYFVTIKYQLINDYHIEVKDIRGVADLPLQNEDQTEKEIISHIKKYQEQNTRADFDINKENMWLICDDYKDSAGTPFAHYFAQDIWAAKKIFQLSPSKHYDIGSRVDGFLAHLLVFCEEVNYIDIRPLPYEIPGLKFMQGDATNLDSVESESLHSLSSLHAIEHFGLGRYGDPIDPEEDGI